MIRSKKRAVGLFALAAVPLVFASAAFACQRLTSAEVAPEQARVGEQVTVRGGNYIAGREVQARLNSRTAPPVGVATASQNGRVEITFRVPDGTPTGNNTVILTQTNAQGVPCPGCPGRDTLDVIGVSTSADELGLDPAVLLTPVGLVGLLLLVGASRRPGRKTEAA